MQDMNDYKTVYRVSRCEGGDGKVTEGRRVALRREKVK